MPNKDLGVSNRVDSFRNHWLVKGEEDRLLARDRSSRIVWMIGRWKVKNLSVLAYDSSLRSYDPEGLGFL